MLLSPVVVGLASAPAFRWSAAGPLILALVALYLARSAADMALRPRQRRAALPWVFGYGAVGAVAGAAALFAADARSLLLVASAAGALYLVHLALRRTRARWDRTVWGELVGVAALCLGAPAGRAAGGGGLDGRAWTLWALCWLFFGSSIFHVRGMLEAARVRGTFGRSERLRVAMPGIAYHVAAAAALFALGAATPSLPPGCIALAVAPAYVRAGIGLVRLSNKLPRLALVGLGESFCALWFTLALSLGARLCP